MSRRSWTRTIWTIISALFLVIGLAGVPDNLQTLMGWIAKLIRLEVDWVSVATGSYARLLYVLVAIIVGLWSWDVHVKVKDKFARSPKLELIPSSGPSPDLRLSVTNKEIPALFTANCRILEVRNDPNQPKAGVYALAWVTSQDRQVKIARDDTAALLIAGLSYNHPSQLGTMTLLEYSSEGSESFDSFRWDLREKSSRPPECDIEIRIFAEGARKPHVSRWTVRPEKLRGPLELLRLDDAS